MSSRAAAAAFPVWAAVYLPRPQSHKVKPATLDRNNAGGIRNVAWIPASWQARRSKFPAQRHILASSLPESADNPME
jgi:hypothetical protein